MLELLRRRDLCAQRGIDQFVQQGREADYLLRDPFAAGEQVQHAVKGLGVLDQQHQVGAASAHCQDQVENAVQCGFVERGLVEPVQQLGHEAVEALVGSLAQRNALETAGEHAERPVVPGVCIDRLAVAAQSLPQLGRTVFGLAGRLGGENGLEP